MTTHSRLIASLLLSLILVLMIPSGESTQLYHSILVANCGTGSSTLTANVTRVSPGSSGTIMFSCGPAGSAITVMHPGNALPTFSLSPRLLFPHNLVEPDLRIRCQAHFRITHSV